MNSGEIETRIRNEIVRSIGTAEQDLSHALNTTSEDLSTIQPLLTKASLSISVANELIKSLQLITQTRIKESNIRFLLGGD